MEEDNHVSSWIFILTILLLSGPVRSCEKSPVFSMLRMPIVLTVSKMQLKVERTYTPKSV